MTEPKSEEKTPTSIEWGIWLQWVLATTVGWMAGWVLTGPVGIGIGPVIGIAQWLVLRRLVREAGWWVWASTIGWVIGWTLIVAGEVIPPGIGAGLASVIASALLGAAIGIAQWLVLRRVVYGAGWWVFASIVGWTVGLPGVLGSTLVGTIVGGLTGFMLDWLLRHPRPGWLRI